MGVATFYKVVRDILPNKIIFKDRHKCSTLAIHMDLFPQKEIFHQQKV